MAKVGPTRSMTFHKGDNRSYSRYLSTLPKPFYSYRPATETKSASTVSSGTSVDSKIKELTKVSSIGREKAKLLPPIKMSMSFKVNANDFPVLYKKSQVKQIQFSHWEVQKKSMSISDHVKKSVFIHLWRKYKKRKMKKLQKI